MTANPSRTRIWRSQYLQSIELVHGVSKCHSLPRHFHEELELGIRQGDGWQFNYRGAMHSVPSNTLVVTQPGEAHHADCASDRDCTYRGLQVGVDLLQQVATEVAGRKIDLPFFPMPLVHDRYLNTQIIQVHQALGQFISQLEQQTLIRDFLAQLILRCAEDPPCQAKLGEERQPVNRVRAYLEDHYNQEVSLEQLAQIANLSSFHLNRSFSKTFGMPPHAYQIQVRILPAKRLLRKEWSIEKVAIKTGFVSQSHFGSHFKRQVLCYSKAIHSRQQECDNFRCLNALTCRQVCSNFRLPAINMISTKRSRWTTGRLRNLLIALGYYLENRSLEKADI